MSSLALSYLPHRQDIPVPVVPGLDESDRRVLEILRASAARSRSAPREDLFRACAMLSDNHGLSAWAAATALTRCLTQALGQAPVFFRRGAQETSFDEAWLLRIAASIRRNDDDSLIFCVASRVAPMHRRNIAFLARVISEHSGRI